LTDSRLVGRCGLYCGACGIYRAYKDGGEFLEKLAKELNCSPQQVRCEGCQALTTSCWGTKCKIVVCTESRKLRFCHECGEYDRNSCEKFGKLAERYSRIGVDLRANLAKIKMGKVAEWLRESEEKHRCPSCKLPIPVYGLEGRCHHCGAGLSQAT